MVSESIEEGLENFLNEMVKKVKALSGIDLVYFLNGNSKVVKESRFTSANNYLDQILDIVNSEELLDNIATGKDLGSFHTYTLLNESGLIVVSKITNPRNLYMIIVAGENEPVDLVSLLKICKEFRLDAKSQFSLS